MKVKHGLFGQKEYHVSLMRKNTLLWGPANVGGRSCCKLYHSKTISSQMPVSKERKKKLNLIDKVYVFQYNPYQLYAYQSCPHLR